MFHRDNKKTVATLADVKKMHSSDRMSRVVNPHQILQTEKRQKQIADYKKLLCFEDEEFENCCDSLLSTLAQYLQALPETRNSFFSGKEGFLNHMMSRCEAALTACRAYFMNDAGKPAKELSKQQQLWVYCLFSASLLRGIGRVVVDFIVDIFDPQGKHLGKWDPMKGCMTQVGAVFYDYDFDRPQHDTYRRRVTLALATMMMPACGLARITEDKDVFEVWLALLDEDLRTAGTLGIILDKAEAHTINRYFQERVIEELNKEKDPHLRFSSQFNVPDDISTDLDIGEIPQAGFEFIKWLAKALGTARLMVNKAPLFSVPGGLLMSPDVFKLFVREHPQFKSWQKVQEAFILLNMHNIAANGKAVQQFQNAKNNSMHSGVVLSAVAMVLPDSFKAVNQATGAVTSYSRSDFSSIAQASSYMVSQQSMANTPQSLSVSGKWVAPGGVEQQTLSNKGR